jgi:hypothetical protein
MLWLTFFCTSAACKALVFSVFVKVRVCYFSRKKREEKIFSGEEHRHTEKEGREHTRPKTPVSPLLTRCKPVFCARTIPLSTGETQDKTCSPNMQKTRSRHLRASTPGRRKKNRDQ